MYESPIKIYEQMNNIQTEIIKKQNEDIYRAILSYGITVDKEELIRALQYDRDQYNKGHADGERDAMDAMIRCKDCKHCSQNTPDGLHWCDEHERGSLMDDDFCSYGERKDDGR